MYRISFAVGKINTPLEKLKRFPLSLLPLYNPVTELVPGLFVNGPVRPFVLSRVLLPVHPSG